MGHAEGEEFVVDVSLIREERTAMLFNPMEIDPHHIAAGDKERSESHHTEVDVSGFIVAVDTTDLYGEDGKDKSDG